MLSLKVCSFVAVKYHLIDWLKRPVPLNHSINHISCDALLCSVLRHWNAYFPKLIVSNKRNCNSYIHFSVIVWYTFVYKNILYVIHCCAETDVIFSGKALVLLCLHITVDLVTLWYRRLTAQRCYAQKICFRENCKTWRSCVPLCGHVTFVQPTLVLTITIIDKITIIPMM